MKALTEEQKAERRMYSGRLRTPEQIVKAREYQRLWAQRNPGKKHTWRKANPDLARISARESMRRRRLRNPEEHRARCRREKGYPEPTRPEPAACEICGQPPKNGKSLHLDHDHKTGKFRGWLCDSHNRAIGHFQDSPDMLRRAAAYLENNG